MAIRHAIYLPLFAPFGHPRIIADLARDAEQSGWDGVFLWDDIAGWDSDMSDPWIALSAAAMVTERVRLGALITPLARRRPWKFARETASLDQLSDGRYYHLKPTVFRPRPVQQPRIPVWIAGTWPHKRPLARMAHWDGMFPLFWGIDEPAEQQTYLRQMVAQVQALRRTQHSFEVVVTGRRLLTVPSRPRSISLPTPPRAPLGGSNPSTLSAATALIGR